MTEEEYESQGWYEANKSYWGTKWDVSYEDCNFSFTPDSITMSPETAWSPPVEFGQRLRDIFHVNVHMEYSESGCNFAGQSIFTPEGGGEVNDYTFMEGKYNLDNEGFWSELQYYIESELENDEGSNKTGEEYAKDFEYVSESDRKEIADLYNKQKESYGTDKSED